MESETVFKMVFGAWAILFLGATGYAQGKAMRKHGSRFAQVANEYEPLLWIRGLVGIPLWFFLIDWLASAGWFPWASISLPLWARWSGVGVGVVVAGLIWWTMVALGSNYRGTTGLHTNHELVTHGPYRFVRHPMQAVAPLISIVLFSLSANWVIGTGALVLIGTISIVRAPVEERELIERFGDEYCEYMQRTGRFFPRFR